VDYFALFGIAVGLSMDAFAVSITNGAVTKKLRFSFALKLAFSFGLFQGIMPVIGWLVGITGASLIESVDHWIALILLSIIGIQMLKESRHQEAAVCYQNDLSWKQILVLAIATSIDALATGVILPNAVGASTPLLMLLAVSIIAAVTFFFCLIGVYIGKKFGPLLSNRAELFGGIVLIAIGIEIFVEHMWFS